MTPGRPVRVGRRAVGPWAAFAVSRGVLFAWAYAGLALLPMPTQPGEWQAFPDALWLDGWARFDSGWYWSIADEGYRLEEGAQSNAAFFPALPVLAGTLSWPLRGLLGPGRAFFVAAVVVSQISFAVAVLGLHRLARLRLGASAARSAVWLLCLFPFSFFFQAAYTEALFLALAVWAFWHAEREDWLVAVSLAALYVLTRIPGVLVGGALAVRLLVEVRRGHASSRDAAWLLLVPAAFAGLLLYFALQLGEPLAFLRVQEAWGRSGPSDLITTAALITRADAPPDLRLLVGTYAVLLVGAAGLALVAFREIGPAYGVLAVSSVALYAGSGLQSTGRHLAVVFPLYLAAAAVLRGRPRAERSVLAGFAVLLLLFSYWFTNWHLVT